MGDRNTEARVWRNRNVVAMGFTSLFADMSYEMGNALLPAFLIAVLHASPLALGAVEGISDGASSFVKSFSGYLSDRTGKRKPLINLGYLLTGVLIPAIGFARSVLDVLLLKLSAWVGRGARAPPRDALLVDSVDIALTGRAFGLQRAMDTVGAVIGPLLALFLLPYMSYSNLFFLTLAPGLVSFLIVLLAVKEVSGRERLSTGRETAIGFVQAMRSVPKKFRLFILGVGTFGIANFGNLLFVYRAKQLLAPSLGDIQASQVSFGLYALLNAVYAIASYPVGHAADKWSSRNLLVLGYVVFAISTLGIALSPPSEVILALVFAAVGIHMALVDTSEASFASELLPAEIRGTGYGLLHSVNGVGDFVSSISVSAVWFVLSPEVGFFYAAVLSLVSALSMFLLTK